MTRMAKPMEGMKRVERGDHRASRSTLLVSEVREYIPCLQGEVSLDVRSMIAAYVWYVDGRSHTLWAPQCNEMR
jgi:hypothetical protein